jgi:tetratricopeptide (TPR) repeat protein
MADQKQQMDGDLAESIAMLEQILEVMPQDTATLKALYNAYGQSGHRDRAFEYLGLLVDAAYGNNDAETSKFVVSHMQEFEEEHPSEAAAHLARLRTLSSSATEASAAPKAAASPSPTTDVDISEELALAWRLYEENQLEQEEYSSILNDLTEVSSKELDVPISVLHVLNDRGFNQMNRIMNYMSSRSGVPCISLSSFELPEQVEGVLPLDVAMHDGALPFGFFGNDLLVAVLNPFNSILMDKVERSSGHRCHAYLVSPADYDAALDKLRAMVASSAA